VSYFRNRYQVGQRCLVHGKVEGGPTTQKRIVHPEIDLSTDLEGQGLLPVYNKPTTTSVGVMRKIVQQAAVDWAERLPSVLPEAVVRAARVTDLRQAMRLIHAPSREGDVDALNAFRSLGHRSLVFDELFFLQLGMALRRRSVEIESGLTLARRDTLTSQLEALLPFRLTGAQQRVLAEVFADMAKPHPLHRLVQGDVGSGKTVVAFLAALHVIESGRPVAFMVPTEVLARQHAVTLRALAAPVSVPIELLTASTPAAERREIAARLKRGEALLVVGTQALLDDRIAIPELGLAIVDEQHRFGVRQRARLAGKSVVPDLLVLTATPIPRTLALAYYGDLEISRLRSRPAGRGRRVTRVTGEEKFPQVIEFLARELKDGRQAFVVLP
ncbi:MAG: DEAD/DEAH box helicase, partial [Gaiellaceae bacterium]